METTVFEWWKRQGKSLAQLAERLNYHPDYVYHVAAGLYPLTESFKARCVLHLGDEARFLFFGDNDRQNLSLRQLQADGDER